MKDAMTTALAPTRDAVFTRQQALDWFKTNYPKIKPATVGAHLTRLSTNATSRVHFSAKPGEDDVLYQIDGSHFRTYRQGEDPTPVWHTSTRIGEPDVPGDADALTEEPPPLTEAAA